MIANLKETKRLYDMGFAILWLKPKSKAPVKAKWTTGPRDSWENLKKEYSPSLNVGVRLGAPSKVGGKYLAVIDVDVKSTDKRHHDEALENVFELFPELGENSVKVMSGRGNGSCHFYVLSDEPATPQRMRVSKDKVKAYMPSAPISQMQKDQLSEEDINEGFRMRPAWEVSVMGEGQQVVLPPSVHPDSGLHYHWDYQNGAVGLKEIEQLVVLNLKRKDKDLIRTQTHDWVPVEVDLFERNLSDECMNLITTESEDGSVALFIITIELVRANFTDQEIMTVLTDLDYEIGKVAFRHAKTQSRARAANWVLNYNIKKARKEFDAQNQFDEEVEVLPELDDEKAAAQTAELSRGSL